jgi:tRNA uracil 4-sulfurtransferase
MNFFVIRYAEVGLKGKNRSWFENLLIKNIRKHIENEGESRVSRIHGRIIVESAGEPEKVSKILHFIPGIANFSQAVSSTHDIQEMSQQAIELIKNHAILQSGEGARFRISSRRSNKKFPVKSPELSAMIGAEVLKQFPDLKVDLTDPQLDLGVEIWPENRSILYVDKIQGQGGLPSGSAGPVISMISGGIDSPVASWFAMKRGCTPIFVHFHSFPFTSEQSQQKVVELVDQLSRYQPESVLYTIPFAEIQKSIKSNCLEKNRTILYRRLMYQIANQLVSKYGALAYITGEALGQVASQTMENLACTEDAADVPVLRPLIAMGKGEITDWAKKIGTYPISIQPFQDCCTVFQPKNPEIHGSVKMIQKDEQKLNIEELCADALENADVQHFNTHVQDKYF